MAWISIDSISAVVLAYLLGSIPVAYLASRLLQGKDIREQGDRNPGAGNAYRTIGPRAGIAVAVADIGKGAVAVLVARVLAGSTGVEMAAGAAVVVGHNWPIFLRLSGGRGAASTVGVLMALVPFPAVPLSAACLLLLPIVRSATIALSLIMIPLPLLAWLTDASYSVVAYTIGLPVMVGIRHYFTSRRPQLQEEDAAGGHALPQG